MARAMQYSPYSQQPAAAQKPMAAAAAKAAPRRMVKIGPLVLIACLILAILTVLLVPMMVSGTAAASSKAAASAAQPARFVAYETAQDAASALGLEGALPAGLPADAAITGARVVEDALLELDIVYGKSTLVYRVATGSDDLSGLDYDELPYTATEDSGATAIGYAGVSEKKLNTAVWTNGDYSFAIIAENGTDAAVMKELVAGVM